MRRMLTSFLVAASLYGGDYYDFEVTPVVGYNFSESGSYTKNYFLMGAEMQYNNVPVIKPELSIFYSPEMEYEITEDKTDVFRIALNGVYDFSNFQSVTPFLKGGVGYEIIDDEQFENGDTFYFDAGTGVKINFTDQVALKLEALYLLKDNKGLWDHNIMVLGGVSFSFGRDRSTHYERPYTTGVAPVGMAPVVVADSDHDGIQNSNDRCPGTPFGIKVNLSGCAMDDDRDGVANHLDSCPTTPFNSTVDAKGCTIQNDTDNDGVMNRFDQCPNTPRGSAVDSNGCPDRVKLAVNFRYKSTHVAESSYSEVSHFAEFMKRNPSYHADIVGHTDNIGSRNYNVGLSKRRAASVKALLIEFGVNSTRLRAIGMGEDEPIATNKTEDGRAANRRIEARLKRY